VPMDWAVHVAPLSVVSRIVPDSPTAVRLLASTQETPRSWLVVPLVWSIQVAPLSGAFTIVLERPCPQILVLPCTC
jgi:hypothetical protein